MTLTVSNPSAADLRAERARQQTPIFVLASKVGIHPFRLGQLLNGKRTLTPAMARKIAKALDLTKDGECSPHHREARR